MMSTISDAVLNVKFLSGGYMVQLKNGLFQKLTVAILCICWKKTGILCSKNMNVLVRKGRFQKNSKTVSWMGGRMTFSAQMSESLRKIVQCFAENPELEALATDFERSEKVLYLMLNSLIKLSKL
jgi:ATP-dependent Lhr-like helicase